jgi:hypothetical protein
MNVEEIRRQVRRGDVRPIPGIGEPAHVPSRAGAGQGSSLVPVSVSLVLVFVGLALAAAFWFNSINTPRAPYPITKFPRAIAEQVTAVQLNVRGGPGSTFAIVAKIPQGEALTAYGSAPSEDGGTWHFVKLKSGKLGYVNAKLVTSSEPTATVTPIAAGSAYRL